MAIGLGNPRDVNSSLLVRPAHVNSDVNERRWFNTGAVLYPEDMNALWAQIRAAMDFYGIADVEGDDTVLQQIFAKFLPLAGGILSGDVNVQLVGGAAINIVVQGEGNARFIAHRFSNNATGCVLQLRKSRGTMASPLAIAQNDQFGNIDFMGKGDVSTDITAIRFQGTGIAATPSPTDMQSRLVLNMIPSGSGSLSELMRWEHATGLSMFGANPVVDQNRHLRLRSYTIATLPSASPAGQMIRISDMGPNGALAQSDGSTWRPYLGGTYVPTATVVTNLDSAVASGAQYIRNGNIVTVSGQVSVDATATGQCLLRMALPFASALSGDSECCGAGTVFESVSSFIPVFVGADTTNDQVIMTWVAAGTGAALLNYTFTYRVL